VPGSFSEILARYKFLHRAKNLPRIVWLVMLLIRRNLFVVCVHADWTFSVMRTRR